MYERYIYIHVCWYRIEGQWPKDWSVHGPFVQSVSWEISQEMIIWVLWALNPVNTGLTLYMIVISLKMSPQDHRVSWHCCGVQWSSFVLVITRNCTVIKTAFQECLCQIWATLVKDFYGLWNQSWKMKSTKRWKHFLRLVCKFLWPTYSLLQVFTKITELSSISWLIDLHSSSYWARNLSFKWKFQASD